ncbi:MAG: hypothetical protein IJ831_04310 [Spirochaetales bacterium]|nr:hypothetical protein [Spirochaetales bacterium]
MGRTFFDLTDGDIGISMGGNMLMDSDGDLMTKVSSGMAMDMNSGELHIISDTGPNCLDDEF